MKSYQIKNCQTIANHYGYKSQSLIAIEEMSELTKEICKFGRGQSNLDALVDEIADVKIMVEQLEYLFGVSNKVDARIDYKLERQLKRMEHEREFD